MIRSRRAAIKEADKKRRRENLAAARKKREARKRRAAAQAAAATQIQSTWRGERLRGQQRVAVRKAETERLASTQLQASWRGASTRKLLKRERRAAKVAAADAVLGLVLRNWFPRRQLWRRRATAAERQRREELSASQQEAAPQIQAAFRGHLARRERTWLAPAPAAPAAAPLLVVQSPVRLAPVPPASTPPRSHAGAASGRRVKPVDASPRRAIWL